MTGPDVGAIEEVRSLERQRCAAVSSADRAALRRTLTPDYLHVHGDGRLMGLAESVQFFGDHPRRVERADPGVRVYGDVAVLNGELVNVVVDGQGVESRRQMQVTQVARRTEDGWRFCTFHATAVGGQ